MKKKANNFNNKAYEHHIPWIIFMCKMTKNNLVIWTKASEKKANYFYNQAHGSYIPSILSMSKMTIIN